MHYCDSANVKPRLSKPRNDEKGACIDFDCIVDAVVVFVCVMLGIAMQKGVSSSLLDVVSRTVIPVLHVTWRTHASGPALLGESPSHMTLPIKKSTRLRPFIFSNSYALRFGRRL